MFDRRSELEATVREDLCSLTERDLVHSPCLYTNCLFINH